MRKNRRKYGLLRGFRIFVVTLLLILFAGFLFVWYSDTDLGNTIKDRAKQTSLFGRAKETSAEAVTAIGKTVDQVTAAAKDAADELSEEPGPLESSAQDTVSQTADQTGSAAKEKNIFQKAADAAVDKAVDTAVDQVVSSGALKKEVTSQLQAQGASAEQVQAASQAMDNVSEADKDTVKDIIKEHVDSSNVGEVTSYMTSGDYAGLMNYAQENMTPEEYAQIQEIYGKYLGQ